LLIALAALLLSILTAATGWSRAVDKSDPQPARVKQPVVFSHSRHAKVGLECKVCHSMAEPGDVAGIPQRRECLNCHQDADPTSDGFRSLFEHERNGRTIEWVRIYQLSNFVFFSHQLHLNAKVGCQTCHGPVASREVLWKEKEISMKACVDCHKTNRASVNCKLCHELNR
jgi:Class III cytochrome C family/Cytochrome c7 and related cytochrome c